MTTWMASSQEQNKTIPQIAISGEGKVKVTPDIAIITLGVQNSGKEAKEVKIQNDVVIDKVLKHLERISEHCTNVAESVYFMVHAKIIKHEKFDLQGEE